jgi:hypothetical protein
MTEFSRTLYNYNNRIVLNDVTTDPTKYILVDIPNITDTLVINTEDDRPDDVGIIDYGSKLGKGQWGIPVTLFASSLANMASLIQTFKQAFNPDLLEDDSTYGETTKYLGYHPMDWTEVVGATSYDFRIFTKAEEIPLASGDPFSGLIRKSVIKLKIADPRKYKQTATTLTGAGVANNAGTVPTPIIITITASGATSTSLQITNSKTSESIYITTALSAGQILILDTGTHSVKLDGIEKRSMIGSNSTWWRLDPGDNTIAITNGANTTVEFSWNSAWTI